MAGNFNVQITVSDSASPAIQSSTTYNIAINNPLPPEISTTRAPSIGAVNLPYSFIFTAAFGVLPLTWNETGALPPGLALSADGVLSGTPTATGNFPITVTAQDSVGQSSASQDFTIQIGLHGFKATGNMAAARSKFTATLLNSSKVLVAGGFSGSASLATAELFDPNSGSFAPTGSMGAARFAHTATLLSDGKVLVTGGEDVNGNFLATAELFDPASGISSPTGGLATARSNHTATLLKNGKVLIVGGDGPGVELSSAELFDPVTGVFLPTGSLTTGRSGHTATLLNDGKVLVTGGLGGSLYLESVELFDPASGSFAPAGSMTTARVEHTATLLNGGKVLVVGLDANANGLPAAELYDPSTMSFAATNSMPSPRSLHTATLLDNGQVLVVGGASFFTSGGESDSLSSAELFDPSSGTFAPTGSMGITRRLHAATLLTDGKVLVMGGIDLNRNVLATAELYQ